MNLPTEGPVISANEAYHKTLSGQLRALSWQVEGVLPNIPVEEHDSKFILLSNNIFLNFKCNSTFFTKFYLKFI
jgi:hypothetical protein